MPERSQAQSAVAGDDSRDALAHLARHERIGQQCPVIMRVRVEMNPGASALPPASTSWVPTRRPRAPSATIRSPETATSPTRAATPDPSMIRACLMIRSTGSATVPPRGLECGVGSEPGELTGSADLIDANHRGRYRQRCIPDIPVYQEATDPRGRGGECPCAGSVHGSSSMRAAGRENERNTFRPWHCSSP